MNSEEKQKITRIFVFLVIAGLVLAYVPLFFVPPPPVSQNQAVPQSDQAAQLAPPPAPAPAPTAHTSEEISNTEGAEGFEGLSEENKSLEELNKLPEAELIDVGKLGREKEAEKEQKEVSEIKKKYYVE